jgi:hypothetical protein
MTSHLAPQVLNTFAAQMLPQMSMTNVQQSKKNAKAKLAALPDLPYRKAWWGCACHTTAIALIIQKHEQAWTGGWAQK